MTLVKRERRVGTDRWIPADQILPWQNRTVRALTEYGEITKAYNFAHRWYSHVSGAALTVAVIRWYEL